MRAGHSQNLDAVKLVNVHLREPGDFVQGHFGLFAGNLLEGFEFKLAQFAVGNDEEIAAAASRVEEPEIAEFSFEILQPGAAARWSGQLCGFQIRRVGRPGTASG